jgi:AcrR family transcriptional regulator
MNANEPVDPLPEFDPIRRSRRRGNVPTAMRAVTRRILDEADAQAVILREVARRVGVSAPAAYRHFASREDLLASVAAEGFAELSASLEAAAKGEDPLTGLGLAYVDFAMSKRGLFRLMFGPLLADRGKYPVLDKAASAAFRVIEQSEPADKQRSGDERAGTIATWGLVHGLSALFIDNLVPEESAKQLARQVFSAASESRRRPPPTR